MRGRERERGREKEREEGREGENERKRETERGREKSGLNIEISKQNKNVGDNYENVILGKHREGELVEGYQEEDLLAAVEVDYAEAHQMHQ